MPRFHTTSRRRVDSPFLIGELVASLLHFSGCKAEHPIFLRYFLFKFLHRVFQTLGRLTLFRPFHDTSCDSCGDGRADLEHIFARRPSARSLQPSFRRIFICFLSNVASDVTLLTALFLYGLSQSLPASISFIVRTFIVSYWQDRNSFIFS